MQDPIPVPPKFLRRFTEAVVFEKALRKACESDPEYLGNASAEPFVDPSDDAEKAFKSYVNKLAHVCDTKRGGETVTGVAILQDVDRVVYVVASNERSHSALEKLARFIHSLFELVRGVDPPFTQVFHHILGNNLPRIKCYLNNIAKKIDFCVSNVSHMPRQENNTVNSERLRASLIELRELVVRAQHAKSVSNDDFVRTCADVVICTNNIQARGRGEYMFLASRGATSNPSEPWRQLRHYMARLRAYHVSARSIISAHKCWPQLFEDVQITTVPSSRPHNNPLLKARMATASAMLGRMVPKEEVALRRAQAMLLEPFGLDELILEVSGQASCKPLVHGEVLVHDFVRRHMSENPDVAYWNHWRYVGSSKPTCRLCAYYFAQITDVTVRESHGNLYPKWRMPDVYDEEGERWRDAILHSIVELIRKDALRTLESKLPRGKADDSSSFPTVAGYFARHTHAATTGSDVAGASRPPLLASVDSGRLAGSEDRLLAGMLERLAFEHDGSDEDDEVGGARL